MTETDVGAYKSACIAAYTAANFILFPCTNIRTPLHKGWQETPETPEELPDVYGVLLTPDLFVIDFDPRTGETQWMAFLEEIAPNVMPETFKVLTPRGGFHLYYRKPTTVRLGGKVPNFKAIEIKQSGQYVNGCGSVTGVGVYEQAPDSLDLEQITEAPDWLLTALHRITPKANLETPEHLEIDSDDAKTKFIVYLQTVDVADSAFHIACEGRDLGLSAEIIAYLMNEYVNPRWTEQADFPTLLAKAQNAFTYGQNAVGSKNFSNDFKDTIAANKAKPADPNLEIKWRLETVKGVQTILPTMGNVICFFRLTEIKNKESRLVPNPLHGLIGFNQFSTRIEFKRPAPWHNGESSNVWNDSDAVLLKQWFHQHQHFDVNVGAIEEGVVAVGHQNAFHPVRDYLNALAWDGVPRVDRMLIEYLSAADSDYSQAISRVTMVGAVKRVFEPGCQHDTMLVVEGRQNTGKTSFVRILGGEWAAEIALNPEKPKENVHRMMGRWIIESPEMEFTRHADVKAIKTFLTIKVDDERLSYEKHARMIKRQSIFIGTVNPEKTGYLRDTTGNRRFLPVATGKINLPALAKDRDQLWAEAVHLYKSGALNHITDPRILAIAQNEQSERCVRDMWTDVIIVGLQDTDKVYWTNAEIAEQILCTNNSHHNNVMSRRISTIMEQLGYDRKEVYNKRYRQKILHWYKPGGLDDVW